MRVPLRIGVLGAARIADEGVIGPARVLGHEVVAVAARDRGRAEALAAERGIARVHDDYAGVITDPGVDLVYDALVNSLHAKWNVAALRAGKDVLAEKPLTSNASEARAVRSAALVSAGVIVEGFHYRHHPVNPRLRELVTSGALGSVRRVDITLTTPPPPASDPRWVLGLARWTSGATCSTRPGRWAPGSGARLRWCRLGPRCGRRGWTLRCGYRWAIRAGWPGTACGTWTRGRG